METIEQRIIAAYIPGTTTLREVASICNTDHHRVKRVLEKAGMPIVAGKRVFSEEHKNNISKACLGRECWAKGKKMPKESLYKNMAAHLRFDVSAEWLSQFDDIEKLKFLNRAIVDRTGRFAVDTEWYKAYLVHFYPNPQFNRLYTAWVCDGKKDRYMLPTLDHIVPQSKGGAHDLANLQFLTWFENRAKNDIPMDQWTEMKKNIGNYLI